MIRLNRNARLLCVLALGHLLAGPLVLVFVHAVTLCKVAIREAPAHGLSAAVHAWESEEFQSAAVEAAHAVTGGAKQPAPGQGSKDKPDTSKITATLWQISALPSPEELTAALCALKARTWTPGWPNAPPAPPPRVA